MIRSVVSLAALSLTACAAVPPVAPAISYHAVGTEPFWDLTIDRAAMQFQDRGTNLAITAPTPAPIHGIAGEIYRSSRLDVNIVHGRCSDGMSDRTYPDTVQITADGHAYKGCGGDPLAP